MSILYNSLERCAYTMANPPVMCTCTNGVELQVDLLVASCSLAFLVIVSSAATHFVSIDDCSELRYALMWPVSLQTCGSMLTSFP